MYARIGCRDPVHISVTSGTDVGHECCEVGYDGCVHTADMTIFDLAVGKFVQIRGDYRKLWSTQFTLATRRDGLVASAV